MTMTTSPPTNKPRDSLWLLTIAPTIWAVHFLLTYITAAIWCAKVVPPRGSLGGARLAIAAYTLVALLGIGVMGWLGYRRQTLGRQLGLGEDTPHDTDTIADRHRFLGFATLLLAALSAVATVFVAMVALFVETCE